MAAPIAPDVLRARFSAAMSAMYRAEVPAYGALIELVEDANRRALAASPALAASLAATDGIGRISEERHGAIRLGTAEELSTMRRAFAVLGMEPVGYYDLSAAGVPVHSTAFRPTTAAALAVSPFRVFTSLLRLDLLPDPDLRAAAEGALAARRIFTDEALRLTAKAEAEGGLAEPDASRFLRELLETFRWHDRATVPLSLYERLHAAHRLVADVASFRGPHINHLTPRTLDIDAVQAAMPGRGIVPKETIEGPPRRRVPILLRQTSFKALEEPVSFADGQGGWRRGTHTARFGEVEQRGAALTAKGRALYDDCLARVQGGDTAAFARFPDDLGRMRAEGLVHVEYALTPLGERTGAPAASIEDALARGLVAAHPVVYEDFLPVSAAGIFRSNLGSAGGTGSGTGGARATGGSDKAAFEAALGAPVADEFALYAAIEARSAERALARLGPIARDRVA